MADRQSHFVLGFYDDNIPSDHYSRFLVKFVDHYAQFIEIKNTRGKPGRPRYDIFSMIKIWLYAYHEDINSAAVVEECCKHNDVYKFISGDIRPCEKTLRNFRNEFGELIDFLMEKTLEVGLELNMTDFEHITFDGTVKKGNTSKFNVLSEDKINTLIKHYGDSPLSDEEIEKLPYMMKRFINRTDISVDSKLELLKKMKRELKKSGQNTVSINDSEARWMLNKKGVKEPSAEHTIRNRHTI